MNGREGTHAMNPSEHEVERVITLLRRKIRQSGFTQAQIQEELGWGHNYVSRIVTGCKPLRMRDLLQILAIIEVPPADFFVELYGEPRSHGRSRRPPQRSRQRSRHQALAPDRQRFQFRSWTSSPVYAFQTSGYS